jgi:hypothetical protein
VCRVQRSPIRNDRDPERWANEGGAASERALSSPAWSMLEMSPKLATAARCRQRKLA